MKFKSYKIISVGQTSQKRRIEMIGPRFSKIKTVNLLKPLSQNRFPSDPKIALIWRKHVRQSRNNNRWKTTKNTKICSSHFLEKHKYVTSKGICRLRKDAVPDKALAIPAMSEGISSNETNTDTENPNIKDTEFVSVAKMYDKKQYNKSDEEFVSGSSIQTVDVSDITMGFTEGASTYRNDRLLESDDDTDLDTGSDKDSKTWTHKEKSEKSELQKKYSHKIKILKQQVQRLKTSRATLKGVIRKYVKNRIFTKVNMLKDHTLYGDLTSPPVRFAMVTASLLGTKLKFQNIDLFKLENKTDLYRKINPLAKVPALVVGDETITDSHAIAMYLCQRSENQDLYPKEDLLLKARVDEMLFYNACTLFPVDSAIFTDYFTGKWPTNNKHLTNWYAALDYLEHRLCKNEWLSGDKMLLSDVCCSMTVSSVTILVPIPEKYQKIKNWMQKLGKLPSYKINEQGLDRLRSLIDIIGPKNNE